MKSKLTLYGFLAISLFGISALAKNLPYCPVGKACPITWNGSKDLDLSDAALNDAGYANSDLQPRGTTSSGNFVCCSVPDAGAATIYVEFEFDGTNDDGATLLTYGTATFNTADSGVSQCWENTSFHASKGQINIVDVACDGGRFLCNYSN